jgi:transcriptional regulator with XRE-family HTH domain
VTSNARRAIQRRKPPPSPSATAAGEHFARQVRQARKARGLSSYTLATRCGKTQGWVVLIEGVKRETRVEDADLIARVLGVPLLPMIDPGALCGTCRGWPPAGFRCLTCTAQTPLREGS